MPALLGIPALISFLGWLLATAIAFIAKYLTKQVLITSLLITLFLGMLIAAGSLFESLLSTISAQLPPEVASAISMIMPSNALVCFYAIISSKAAVFVFSVKDRLLSYIQGGAD
ncbi:TPA: phage coat protein [Klebsiella oxytoca]|uniref:Phage coat protein n=1 Tax=Klebsiella oxytoca TaxID=571 RepID=A0AAN5LDJ7_KLEOX|nr:phage coat protein [Klebsiella oxytoca]